MTPQERKRLEDDRAAFMVLAVVREIHRRILSGERRDRTPLLGGSRRNGEAA